MIHVEVAGTGRLLVFDFDKKKPVQRDMADDLRHGGYEPATWKAIQDLLKPGDRCVDVGAHVGVLTCLMAACVGPSGHVDAFEPDAYNRGRLERHLILNNLTWVKVHAEAVSDATGYVTFYGCADNDGGHAIWNPGLIVANARSRAHPVATTVKTVRLDDVVHGDIRFIKSDTEGADLQVMRGARGIIERDHPTIISEIHRFGLKQLGTSEPEYRTWFRDRGYAEVLLLDHQGNRAVAPEETVLDDVVFNMRFTHAA